MKSNKTKVKLNERNEISNLSPKRKIAGAKLYPNPRNCAIREHNNITSKLLAGKLIQIYFKSKKNNWPMPA